MINRTIAPPSSLPRELNLPEEKLHYTKNQIELHSIYADSADVVRLSLVFGAGSRAQSLPYQAMSTISMLCEGCVGMSSAEIAEHFDFYGIYFDTSVDRDAATITVAAASEFLPHALKILELLIGQPTFPERELEVYKAKKREQMVVENQKPSYIARRNFASALFGEDHPYGRFADPCAIDALTRDDLVSFHSQRLTTKGMFAVCSGKVTGDVLAQVSEFLDSLPRAAQSEAIEPCSAPTVRGAHRTIVRQESVQSSIRLGCLMPTKADPDFIALQLLVTVFGGYFSSRLMQNLREQRGYTYGVYASLVTLEYAAYMAIACDVGGQYRDDAIVQIHHEMQRLRDELIAEDELAMAKNTIVGELMRLLDGPFGIADIAIENLQSGMPTDYLNIFLRQINATDAVQLQRVAQKYFNPAQLTQVVVTP